MVELNNIREKLAKFLANEISLPDFEDWFVQQTWGVRRDDSEELRQVVHAIELRLSEFSSEHLSEQALRKELTPFVTSLTPSLAFGGIPIAPTLPMDVTWLSVGFLHFGRPAGKESSVVFV